MRSCGKEAHPQSRGSTRSPIGRCSQPIGFGRNKSVPMVKTEKGRVPRSKKKIVAVKVVEVSIERPMI